MNLKKHSGLPEHMKILTKITRFEAKVGVVGVGYVGQALVEELVSVRFRTYGFDVDRNKPLRIRHKLFTPTYSIEYLATCDIICVCVPTPIDENRQPDLTYLTQACRDVAKFSKRNQLILIESTVAPGTLRNVVLPIFTNRGKKCGEDFYLAISPERIDPGNTEFTIKNTPKVVGGIDKASTKLAFEFYSSFVDKVVQTSTPEVAELSKMLENTFRLINISLVNEIKDYADKAGIDIWEAIDVAATKPFAFMPHYPGPGVGGHCIPVDPVYLLKEAKKIGINLKTVEAALQVNEMQPKKVVQEAKKLLNGRVRNKLPKMLLLGISYKPNTADTRESPGVKILEEAKKEGFDVSYFDSFVPKLNGYTSKNITLQLLSEQDIIIIATDHQNVPYGLLTSLGKPIIDTRNIMRKYYLKEIQRFEEKYT